MSKLLKRLRGGGKDQDQETASSSTTVETSISQLQISGSPQNQEQEGLFSLIGDNDQDKTVDVVAVHGLQGHLYKAWTHENGFFWLRDALPQNVPFARIMTFGYESSITFGKSVSKVDDKALELLNRLSAKRLNSKGRPIVFICHSFGGIVVKKALVLAHERSSDPAFKDILENVRAIAFLGVPHSGSGTAWWGTFAANALKASSLGSSINTSLVEILKKGSPTLIDISKQFLDRTEGLTIYTFYERKKLSGVVVR